MHLPPPAWCKHMVMVALSMYMLFIRSSHYISICLLSPQLLTSAAVHRWGTDIQEGIYTMLQLLVDLVATRLQHQPVPVGLLGVLSTVSYGYVKKKNLYNNIGLNWQIDLQSCFDFKIVISSLKSFTMIKRFFWIFFYLLSNNGYQVLVFFMNPSYQT